ncbi:MAG: NAD(P)H-hydrate epimerase [bacterium]|nr:NAD(P)H-hydrate epimerase [bacterium]
MQGYENELKEAFGSPVYLTALELRKIDETASQELGLPGLVLMENAGLRATDLARTMLPTGSPSAVILCGAGNNGGDGYVIARQLHLLGIRVKILWSAAPSILAGDALINAHVARNLGIPMESLLDRRPLPECHLVIDALLGTGFEGPLREPLADAMLWIQQACQQQGASILAVDVPSGLDANTGRAATQTIQADETVAFVAQKTGFQTPTSSLYTGKVHVVSIGVPASFIYQTLRIV